MEFRKVIKKQRGEAKKQAASQPAFKSLICLSSIGGAVKFLAPVDGSVGKFVCLASKVPAGAVTVFLDGVFVDELQLSDEEAVSVCPVRLPLKAGNQVEFKSASDVEITLSFIFTAMRKSWKEEL